MHFDKNIISSLSDTKSSDKMKDQAAVKENLGPPLVSGKFHKVEQNIELSDCHSLDKTGEESGGTWG